ncbi:LGFP repeat-containing protein [Frankia sp. QA3]|uniref:LGFP repeat-containing protein n=1 Tax=Frankia sp. QA3 TaxID=710111 RepID=UPI000269BD12|nr:hypothetical protein [Frankia sp. QA3]EIV91349.1 hypothetical protein FraQA3DRAFT_0790 [Frankia sp. QA3]
MSLIRRVMIMLAVAVAAAVSMIAIGPGTASAAGPCDPRLAPYGLIGERWHQLGGAGSALACPTTGERDVYLTNGEWAGKRQYFQGGEITWSPRQGSRMVIAAWESGGYAHVNWGPTDPYHYDRFLVRYTAHGSTVQREVRGGTSGQFRVVRETTGGYRFIIEGCDGGGIGGSKCRQGWTLSTATYR